MLLRTTRIVVLTSLVALLGGCGKPVKLPEQDAAEARKLILGRWRLTDPDSQSIQWANLGPPVVLEFSPEEAVFPVDVGGATEIHRAFGSYEIRDGWFQATLNQKFGVLRTMGPDGNFLPPPLPPPPVEVKLKVYVTVDQLIFADEQGNIQKFARVTGPLSAGREKSS